MKGISERTEAEHFKVSENVETCVMCFSEDYIKKDNSNFEKVGASLE